MGSKESKPTPEEVIAQMEEEIEGASEEKLWKLQQKVRESLIATQLELLGTVLPESQKTHQHLEDLLAKLRPTLTDKDHEAGLKLSEEYLNLVLDVIGFSVTLRVRAEIVNSVRDIASQARVYANFLNQYAPLAHKAIKGEDTSDDAEGDSVESLQKRCCECERKAKDFCRQLELNKNYDKTLKDELWDQILGIMFGTICIIGGIFLLLAPPTAIVGVAAISSGIAIGCAMYASYLMSPTVKKLVKCIAGLCKHLEAIQKRLRQLTSSCRAIRPGHEEKPAGPLLDIIAKCKELEKLAMK